MKLPDTMYGPVTLEGQRIYVKTYDAGKNQQGAFVRFHFSAFFFDSIESIVTTTVVTTEHGKTHYASVQAKTTEDEKAVDTAQEILRSELALVREKLTKMEGLIPAISGPLAPQALLCPSVQPWIPFLRRPANSSWLKRLPKPR